MPCTAIDEINGAIDSAKLDSKQLEIQGWVIDFANKKPAKELLIFINGQAKVWSKPSMARPDLVKGFNNEAYLKSGFDLDIQLSAIGFVTDALINNVQVYALSSGHYKLLTAFKKNKPTTNAGDNKTLLPPIGVSTVAAITSPAQVSPALQFTVDADNIIGKHQQIKGWAFIENQQTKGQKVYVQLEKPDGTVVHYSTTPVERPDLVTGFKNPLYKTAGFSALIPLTDGIDINACTIRFVVKNKQGTYKSQVWKAGRG